MSDTHKQPEEFTRWKNSGHVKQLEDSIVEYK